MLEHFRHNVHGMWMRNHEMNEIYLNLGIRAFALSMVGIFVPIYLLSLGFTIFDIIMKYMILTYAVNLVSLFAAAKFMRHFGMKHAIFVSMPFVLLNIILLYILNFVPVNIPLIAVIGGIGNGFYWMGVHSDFMRNSGGKDISKKTGMYFSLPKIGAVVGPLLGGFIIAYYNFHVLFAIALLVMLMSVIPLVHTKDFRQKAKYSLRELLNAEKKYFWGSFADGMRHIVEYFFWPVIVFLMAADPLEIGAIGTILQLAVVTIPIIIARLHNRIDIKVFMKVGSVMYAGVMGYIFLYHPAIDVILTTIVLGVASIMITMPFYTMSVKHAKDFEAVEWVLFRETGINLGRLTMLILGLFFLMSVIPATGIFALVYLLI